MALWASLQSGLFSLSVGGTGTILPPGFGNPIPGSIGPFSVGGQLQLGTGVGQINEIISYNILPLIPASGTVTLVLSGTLTDIVNQINVPLARLKGFLIEHRSLLQDPTNGGGASQITCGVAPVHPWTGILNATGQYKINNGAWWAHGDFSAAGMLIQAGSSDQLLITNNDGINAAGVRISFFGSQT